ncbi:hypothetical protein GCM10020255_044270 [Rhodococcus baikonurensis]
MTSSRSMVGLFAGIGGLELGLSEHGWNTELLCEIDPGAQAVLRSRFADVPLHGDVTKLRALPSDIELVAAGFPARTSLKPAKRQASPARARAWWTRCSVWSSARRARAGS